MALDYGKRGTPKPFCLTCGVTRVRQHRYRYCSHRCVPTSIRLRNSRLGIEKRTYLGRRRRFEAIYQKHIAGRPAVSKDVLFAAFAELASLERRRDTQAAWSRKQRQHGMASSSINQPIGEIRNFSDGGAIR